MNAIPVSLNSPNVGNAFNERESFITCRNSQGLDVRATPLRLGRYLVVFEVYNPYSILQLSEVLSDFKIVMNERLVYSGRAVVSNLMNTGIVLVCEVTLDESWLDVDVFSPINQRDRLRTEFEAFLREWNKVHTVLSEFKVVVADMHTLLEDLRRWLEQVELGIRSTPSGDRAELEREVLQDLGAPILPSISSLYTRFEEVAARIQPDLQPTHRNYIKRKIHPLVLCSPFAYRTFQKPLGYAGDYEMVNMILRDPYEGSSLFAKMVNVWFLNQAPAEAHRNRIIYLRERLIEETTRKAALGQRCKILNLGCGPAREVQDFLRKDEVSSHADFLLLDFNDETLADTGRLLEETRNACKRQTGIQTLRKSVHQVLKEGSRVAGPAGTFDFVYCAGLYDYLSDRVCKRLTSIFYEMAAPEGLVVVTNVDPANPNRNTMEYVLEWHLTYRNMQQLEALRPEGATPDRAAVKADATGVNVYLELRKPARAVSSTPIARST